MPNFHWFNLLILKTIPCKQNLISIFFIKKKGTSIIDYMATENYTSPAFNLNNSKQNQRATQYQCMQYN
ncbi:hypothetical protein GLYMA_13G268700v4 [Glycine max]|uniref:Uncharacterized protein n=1 Tax=Glycine max TaxID=3847 RepID=K7M266_SOYBN|nr:hypothetical protein GYH30_037499 [Glycine max]KRH21939.1 hypothetical protein GLYMA_13G268700v4 [Glycine max]